MFERYTERARRTLFFARYEASVFGSYTIETRHLLLGLLREGPGITGVIFTRHEVSFAEVQGKFAGGASREVKVPTSVEIPFSTESKRVLQWAAEEADRMLHPHIGTEHLLLGLLQVGDEVTALLAEYGLRADDVREEIVRLLNETPAGSTRRTPPVASLLASMNGATKPLERLEQIKGLIERLGETEAGGEPASDLIDQIFAELDALKPYLIE